MGWLVERKGNNMITTTQKNSMRLYCRAASLCAMVLLGTMGVLLSAPPALATEWKICNASSESASVAIVFDLNDNRHYISKGWWTIPPNGGCKVVFNGNLPVKGAFMRAEGSRGAVWEGDNLFCTSHSRFEIPNANVDERACRARGSQLKAYQMHVINKPNFTTTLRGSQPATHGFGNDNIGVPVRE
jgi:uncharacterized membrane protein